MTTIIVPADGSGSVSNANFNDVLQLPAGYDVLNGAPVEYQINGSSTVQSLYIGYDIQADLGFLASSTLTGTGNITGPTDASVGRLPLLDNYGMLDLNGTISTSYMNDGTTTVSSGERLNLVGDLFSSGTILIGQGGELDLNDQTSALVYGQLTNNGTLKSSTSSATFIGTAANTGTIAITAGMLLLDSSVTGNGTITIASGATLDAKSAPEVSGTVVVGAGGTLVFAQSTVFDNPVQISPAGTTVELYGLVATGATVANGNLVITTTTGNVSLAETGLPSGGALPFSLVYNQNGALVGSAISTPTATSTPTPTGTGSSPGASSSAPVYRFFDKTYGTHLFTQSLAEAQTISATRPDLSEETNNFGAVSQTAPSAEPVYRFFETGNGTHFFTANYQEYLGLITPGAPSYRPDFTLEASSTFYEDSTPQQGDVAVYRLFDATHGTQFLTGSQTEYTGLTTPGSSTYRADLTPEGTAFYAPAGSFTT